VAAMTLFSRVLAVCGLAALVAVAAPLMPVQAQVNPTASAVTEDELFRALGRGEVVGRVSIPNAAAGTLIRPENRTWAETQGAWLHALSIWSVVGMIALLALFYLIRGRIRIDKGFSGRRILRFNAVERFAHWTLATTFIILALTGLNLIIGKTVLLPLIGESAFGTLSAWGKIAHNYLAWPFMAALVLVFLLWVIHNIPSSIDWEWIKRGGGLFTRGVHPPARKFNAGQKLVFWVVVLGGAAMSYTGIMLLFPAEAGSAADWQLYQVIHALVAAGMSALVLAHIYIGSVGMEGAFDAMGSGEVDENWAKEHHSLWVEELQAEARRASRAAAQPAE
jgi:formate dehydrogenase subunit gamma